MTRAIITVLGALFLTSSVAIAEDIGIPVTVQVVDIEGVPIATAVVRHPMEADRHRVNTETGRWTASILYMPNGDELIFEKNMELEFEVSAPSYENATVKYIVRKRKNLVPVVLNKMDFTMDDDEDLDDPVIQFGRDKPLDK
jgi:hypothetical protein